MISSKIADNLKKSSWIRAMFEEGAKLKSKYGSKNVFDFSIGNPEFEPPAAVADSIIKTASDDNPGSHRYMSNAGYDKTRSSIAEYINSTKGSNLDASHVVMTCGAAGGLNVVLKTILNPGDEVIVFSPYFVEYLFYIDNHRGRNVVIPTHANTFLPDIKKLADCITEKTRAVIINNPNNPTGVVYDEYVIRELSAVLDDGGRRMGTHIYLISDEPYDRIVYDGIKIPCVFGFYKNSIIVNSFSKSHALPGERIGYIAVNDRIEDSSKLINGLVFCNRTLGFVNAPAFMQRVVEKTVSESVDIKKYLTRRDILYNHLVTLGFECVKPAGAFYLFPRSPVENDVEFVRKAQQFNLLLVPGSGFGCPGYFRMSYCIDLDTIKRSLPAFEKLAREFDMK